VGVCMSLMKKLKKKKNEKRKKKNEMLSNPAPMNYCMGLI